MEALRFSDFSKDALVNMLEMSDEYYRVCIEGWADSVAERYGRDDMHRIQAEAWRDTILPQLRDDRQLDGAHDDEAEALISKTQEEVEAQAAACGVILVNPYKPKPEWAQYSEERWSSSRWAAMNLLLAAIESWALVIVMRDGLDDVAFQWTLWSEKLLPAAKDIKWRWMKISGDPVEAFMKDIQVDEPRSLARPSR